MHGPCDLGWVIAVRFLTALRFRNFCSRNPRISENAVRDRREGMSLTKFIQARLQHDTWCSACYSSLAYSSRYNCPRYLPVLVIPLGLISQKHSFSGKPQNPELSWTQKKYSRLFRWWLLKKLRQWQPWFLAVVNDCFYQTTTVSEEHKSQHVFLSLGIVYCNEETPCWSFKP